MLPRRSSLSGDPSTSSCIIADCAASATRRGGYCVDHHNTLASPNVIPENKVPEMVCLGHTCQGLIENGYCQRHRQLAGAGDIQTLSPLSPPLQGIKNKKKKPSLVQEQLQGGNRERGQEILEQFLESLHAISSQTELHLAAEEIIKQTCLILMAERATIFYVDEDELVLMIAKGAKNIRLPKSQGIAGWVATEGQMLNIIDAYAEKKFDSSFDKSSGFRTRNILAAPIVDQGGKVIAVLQVINKIIGSFTKSDEVLLENMAFHCSVVLRNAQQYEASRRSEQKVLALLEMVQMLHSQQSSSASLIFTLSNRSHTLVDADRCTLYLCDVARDQLVVMTGDVDIRIPLTKGIAGHVASTGKIVNIPDCYKDERFNPAVDKQTGYRTKSMLCMPIPADGEVIGVLQLINRLDESQFTTEDEQILTTLLSIAGPILKKTNVFAQKERQSPREVPIPVTSGPPQKNKNRFTPSLLPISKLQENDD